LPLKILDRGNVFDVKATRSEFLQREVGACETLAARSRDKIQVLDCALNK